MGLELFNQNITQINYYHFPSFVRNTVYSQNFIADEQRRNTF